MVAQAGRQNQRNTKQLMKAWLRPWAGKMKAKARGMLFVALLLADGGFCSGCASVFDSGMSDWRYDENVDYYKSRGMSQRDAERSAFEDNFFDQMNNGN